MAIGTAGFLRSRSGRNRGLGALRPILLLALLALGACHPVDTWRDLTGASKDDPDPETTPNTKNLAAGEAAGYPNLATVPPPPTQALTAAQRDKLTQSLVADRTNAKYTDEKLRAGFSVASAAPPPPPPPLPTPAESGKGKTGPAATAKGTAAPGAAAASATTAGNAAGTATAVKPAAKSAAKSDAQGVRKAGEPPEPGPKESSLQSPQIEAPPQPEAPQPAPPPPALLKKPAAAAARLPGPPPAAPLPAGIGAAAYQPPPPPPSLPPPPPPTHTGALAGRAQKPPRPVPVDTAVGQIAFAGNSANLTDSDKPVLERVVARYRQNPAKIRIVGYAGATSPDADQLAAFHAALGRAQAVASALTKAGIPANRILVEAAPAGADVGAGRAEILFEH